jgi:hypothetical protein
VLFDNFIVAVLLVCECQEWVFFDELVESLLVVLDLLLCIFVRLLFKVKLVFILLFSCIWLELDVSVFQNQSIRESYKLVLDVLELFLDVGVTGVESH